MALEARKQTEADFHDRRASDKRVFDPETFENTYSNKKLYSVTRTHRRRMDRWIAKYCQAGNALDFCCGEGEGAIKMAKAGATVHGIDISSESLEIAKQNSRGLDNPPMFAVMDAESLEFPDNFFDAIYAAGCLHHLDLQKTFKELHRVLKPSGSIICNESLAHNPLFQLYRKSTPHLRTPWEVPHILKVQDIQKAHEYFQVVDVQYHYLLSILAVPLRKNRYFDSVLSCLEAVDSLVLKIPGLRLMAWQSTFEMSLPKHKS
jgi:ubiquinone/menaquinone biosynthesis C-methylase UbiE